MQTKIKNEKNILLIVVLALIFLASTIASLFTFQWKTYSVSADEAETKYIDSAWVTLNEDIIINYQITVPENYTKAEITFSYLGKEYTYAKQDLTAGMVTFSFNKVTPQYLTENVGAELVLSGEGQQNITDSQTTFSVKSYAETLLSKTDAELKQTQTENSAMRTLLVDLLYYGDEAQQYTSVTDTLATSGLNNEQKAYKSTFTTLTSTDFALTGATSSVVRWKSAGLRFDYNVSMYFNFITTETIDNLSLKVIKNGTTTTITDFATKAGEVLGETIYTAKYMDVKATEFDEVVTLQIYQGDTAIGKTATYSVKSYVYAKQADATMMNLAQATYNYGVSAKNYLNNVHTHNYVDGYDTTTHYQICSLCNDKINIEEHTFTASEATIGTQVLTKTCNCGYLEQGAMTPDVYHNITKSDVVGSNTFFYNTSGKLDRTGVDVKDSAVTSANVKKAVNLAYNTDYIQWLYGGTGFKFNLYAEQAGTALSVFKAASGWISYVSTDYASYKTENMQFNKIFEVTVNGQKINIPNEVLLYGAEGGYEVLANWTYVSTYLPLNQGLNEIKFMSLQPLKEGFEHRADGIYNISTDTKLTAFADIKNALLYADVGVNGTQSSPQVDSIAFYGNGVNFSMVASSTLSYDSNTHWYACNCTDAECNGKAGEQAHDFTLQIVSESNLATFATCTAPATYYYTCVCGAKGSQTFSYGEKASHTYVATCGDGEHWLECSVCHDKTNYTTEHIYQVTSVEENWIKDANGYVVGGTQTLHLECACGETTTKTINLTDSNYIDITANNLSGTNDQNWMTGNYKAGGTDNRTVAVYKNTGSAVVTEALKISYGGGYATNLYGDKDGTGGAKITVDLGVTTSTIGTVVLKISSGFISSNTWTNNTASTMDMQFNKVFAVSVLHSDGTSSQVNVSNDVILKGATGNYAIMANWQYISFNNLTLSSGDKIVFTSLAQLTDDGQNFLYWDCAESGTVASSSLGSVGGTTQSSVNVDSVAIYKD